MSGSKKRRVRNYVVVGFIVVLIIAGFFIYRAVHGGTSAQVTYTTQAVQKLTLTVSVSGTGNVVLGSTASVSPGISGQVSNLQAKVGDKVKKGQVLFTLINAQLDLDVANATNQYNQAQQSVDQAKLSLLQAQQKLDQLEQQRAAQSTSAVAEMAAYVVAPTTSEGGQTTTTSSQTTTTGSSESTTTTSPPQTTTTTSPPRTTTTSPFNTQPSTTTTTISALDIEVAQQQVTNAQFQVTAAKTQVQSAQLSLQQAKDNAALRQVAAPLDGTITALNVSNGDQLSSSGQVPSQSSAGGASAPIVITDLSSFEVTVSLAETDVPSVALGQKVVLTFDALPDLTLTGKVSEVDSNGTVSQGVVSYNATITPDTSNDSIKGGMTTTANIITKVVSDALVVPNAAVKTDTSGNKYVQILQSGKPVNQTVEVGISTDTYTQITSGLTEGQQVVTQTVNPNASTTTTARRGTGGGGAFPGGGTFPGGGVQIPGL